MIPTPHEVVKQDEHDKKKSNALIAHPHEARDLQNALQSTRTTLTDQSDNAWDPREPSVLSTLPLLLYRWGRKETFTNHDKKHSHVQNKIDMLVTPMLKS